MNNNKEGRNDEDEKYDLSDIAILFHKGRERNPPDSNL